MQYLRVVWDHNYDDEPIVLYHEIDASGYEVRKVERYRDGREAWADSSQGTTELSETPIGSIAEIAKQVEFRPEAIGSDEFEAVWRRATVN